MDEKEIVKEQLKKHEGFRAKPYYCTADKLTIGYGTNLDARGVTREEAEILMMNEVDDCIRALKRKIPDIYNNVNEYRRAVLINMCYNLGIAGLMTFKQTLKHIQEGNYNLASKGMLNSKWATQVGNRAKELAGIMLRGYA